EGDRLNSALVDNGTREDDASAMDCTYCQRMENVSSDYRRTCTWIHSKDALLGQHYQSEVSTYLYQELQARAIVFEKYTGESYWAGRTCWSVR
ncbi:hypothetical protein GYMLUDRAFT_50922, partial [Collybiopsis luxurians FD-317 M1]